MDAMRELKLNVMRLYECANDRTAQGAVHWLKWFKLPIRLLHRGKYLELGGNNSMVVDIALKMVKAHGFVVRRQIPWKPPEILHEHYKGASR